MDLQVAQGLVLEFIGISDSCLAVADETVREVPHIPEILRILQIEVLVEESDFPAFLHNRHVDLYKADEDMTEVIHIAAVRHLMDRHRNITADT